MIEATRESHKKFLSSCVGKIADVLFETVDKNGYYIGYTPNYVSVMVKSGENICGSIKSVKITGFETSYCVGELI